MPVIFLTSKDDEIDEILGLRMGADDYITKPFSQRLLIERIRAVLRRRGAAAEEPSDNRSRRSCAATCSLDLDRHRARGEAGWLT